MCASRVKLLAAAAALAAFFTPANSYADSGKSDVGLLICTVRGGAAAGAGADLSCDFETVKGDVERYSGRIGIFAADRQIVEAATISWAVLAPGAELSAGMLSGQYISEPGETVRELVGGADNRVSLLPLGLDGDPGLNAALGVTELAVVSAMDELSSKN